MAGLARLATDRNSNIERKKDVVADDVKVWLGRIRLDIPAEIKLRVDERH